MACSSDKDLDRSDPKVFSTTNQVVLTVMRHSPSSSDICSLRIEEVI